jgi:hypothetical protein
MPEAGTGRSRLRPGPTTTTEQLAHAIHAAPFRPFTIHLADQRTLSVPHPHFIAYRPGTRTAVVIEEDGAAEIIDLLLVVSIRTEEPAPGAGGKK